MCNSLERQAKIYRFKELDTLPACCDINYGHKLLKKDNNGDYIIAELSNNAINKQECLLLLAFHSYNMQIY